MLTLNQYLVMTAVCLGAFGAVLPLHWLYVQGLNEHTGKGWWLFNILFDLGIVALLIGSFALCDYFGIHGVQRVMH
jgi:hypothetical protein